MIRRVLRARVSEGREGGVRVQRVEAGFVKRAYKVRHRVERI